RQVGDRKRVDRLHRLVLEGEAAVPKRDLLDPQLEVGRRWPGGTRRVRRLSRRRRTLRIRGRLAERQKVDLSSRVPDGADGRRLDLDGADDDRARDEVSFSDLDAEPGRLEEGLGAASLGDLEPVERHVALDGATL